jgi:DNA mismatch repair ATPase MutS
VNRSEKLFADLSTVKGDSETIREIRQTARQAHVGLQQFRRIMQPAALSRNPWTTIFVYMPLQFLFLWDFHILALLERWQQRHHLAARRWFAALGCYEAIESFASLAHDNPGWAFPVVREEHGAEFIAEGIGHPLLSDAVRVTNDVQIGPAGTLLLVTGSNMSGKSTLLRAVGTNAALAQAGSPVCARRLTMPPLTVVTSIRIVDALEKGVSLFMAEVLRLKHIVDLARRFTRGSKRTMLCLLDEILHGTNSAERRIAVRRVLAHLLGQNVIGAVTTHDLELADDPALKSSFQFVHFRESLETEADTVRMTFDYKMRSGIAPTTNALKLLDIVGLAAR